EVSLEIVFDRPTMEELGRYIEESLTQSMVATAPLIERVSQEQALPLSFAQQRLWFLDRMEGASPAYNVPLAVRIRGEINLEVLESSLAEIERRHETLRTVFQEVAGELSHGMRAEVRIRLERIDLSRIEESDRERQWSKLAAAEARRPFDLSWGPVWRASLFKFGREDHALMLTIHHVVSDDWSM